MRDVTNALGKRERQIVESVYRRGRATAAEVLADLPDAPSYSSVRGMLRHLEGKGYLRHERDGLRYVYVPTSPKGEVRASALSHVVRTFFDGSVSTAVAALLESRPLTQAEYERLSALLDAAPREDDR
ncbi:MAG: BlaI/MecI/CopY family transcriptional regulator [Alphaproteobacteria bacterium]|nr:BlaI/MecI/CopY family transcriptional regulator [Alphaproteobacteria bacterium]